MHWHIYNDYLQLNAIAFNSVSVSRNVIVTVGFTGEKALIIMGKRN
jgi:hypothetical protein